MHTNIFSLNPSFFRTFYIKEKLEKFNFNLDPEKQIRYNLQSKSFNKPKLVLYGIQYQNSMIIDIGKIFHEMASFEKWDSSQIGSTSWKIKKLKFYMSILLKIKYTLYLIILKLRYCS